MVIVMEKDEEYDVKLAVWLFLVCSEELLPQFVVRAPGHPCTLLQALLLKPPKCEGCAAAFFFFFFLMLTDGSELWLMSRKWVVSLVLVNVDQQVLLRNLQRYSGHLPSIPIRISHRG